MAYRAAEGLSEIALTHMGMFGPTYPPRLPTEFTMPIPAAAAVPVRNAVGIGQNTGSDPMIPVVATDKKSTDTTGLDDQYPLRIRPTPPSIALNPQ